MKVLIFGVSGFIGSHLKKRLEKEKYEIFTGKVTNGISYFDRYDIDYILYLSSYGNMYTQTDEKETINANILGLFNTLSDTRSVPYKGFINFSSSSVMLDYETMYSATKGAGERIVKAFVNKYDKPVVNVRPFSVIGQGEQKEHLIPQLIESSLTQKKVPFVAEPRHDFIGIDDFCEAIVTLLPHCGELRGKSIDIGTGMSYSNQDVLDTVESVIGKQANVETLKQMRPYDNKHWVSNSYDLYNLGWKPKQSLEEIVKTMIG